MKTLEYWSNIVWQVSLCEETLKFRRKLLLKRSLPSSSGWAIRSLGKWLAVYRKGDELWFRCDDWACRIDTLHQCVLDRKSSGSNIFILSSGGVVVFQHQYKVSSWGRKIDPTYDDIDLQGDDFFLWLFRLWNDPKGVDGTVRLLAD
jgi:hypothetical protein